MTKVGQDKKQQDVANEGVDTELKASDYVHLHNHTHYSLLDGLTKVGELVGRVKDLRMSAVAMTDHGTLSGAIEFYKTCTDSGVKPIIGIETYVAARSRHDRDPAKDKMRYHLILLAMNNTGYQNLMQLSTLANLEGMYYKPRIDHELLEKYNEGLIAMSACAGGEIGERLRNGDYEKAKETAQWYKGVFGDRYYLEIQDHNEWETQKVINEGVFKLGKELDIQCVLSSDAHYVMPGDQEAHEILLCVGTAANLSDKNRMTLKDFHLHVTDPKEVIERWGKDHPEIIRNTKVVADRCSVSMEFGKILIPRFDCPDGLSEKEYLDQLVYRGLAVRYNNKTVQDAAKMSNQEIRDILTDEIRDRVDMELALLERMGYNGYFLIVHDFVNWGKDRGIIFGPGRGSAAGSIISYSLNITDLDPLAYGLIFERFLNPDRISMPDIDIDIQDTRRDEVIQYCVNKYGPSRVSNIVTFGKMAARAAVRDVARVLEVPYNEADRIAKLIPQPVQGRHIPLKISVTTDPDFKKEYESNPTAKRVIDFAMRLEGTIRSHGVHACGVVIAPDDLVKYLPLEMAQKGVVSTQFPMGQVEDIGLLKMDFLGLSNLTIINSTLRIIKKVYKNDIILPSIPLDDEKTYELFQRGDTTGIFQFESAGMKRYLKGLKPTVFDDLIAMAALYRPGPMQFIDSFIRRKHGEEKITYLHERMEPSLKNTYGILVYQEQFMQISKDWCGFTGGQADTLRKAVGKKKIDLMMKIKPEFVEGAVKHSGVKPELAEKFWNQLEEFANYCFVKSHAACYAMIAYWTAYLKAYYPDAFMAALMTSDLDDTDRLAIEIAECNHMGLKVLPPDVNESYVEFGVVPDKKQVRFGMAAVKGVGKGAVEEILRAREDGEFLSVGDFAKKVSSRKCNRKAWESLTKAGAFDNLADRSDILYNLDTILGYASKLQKEAVSGQADMFGLMGSEVAIPEIKLEPNPTPYNDREKLVWERELLGLYLSAHPLDKYTDYFREQTVPLASITPDKDKKAVTVGGVISDIRVIMTKSNTKMSFVKLEDKSGESEIIVFPNLHEEIGGQLAQDVIIKVSGKITGTDKSSNITSEAKIIADEIAIITNDELENYQVTGKKMKEIKPRKVAPDQNSKTSSLAVSKRGGQLSSAPDVSYADIKPIEDKAPKKLYVHIKKPDDHESLLKLKQLLNENLGLSDVILVLGNDQDDNKSAIRLPFRVNLDRGLPEKVAEIYGAESVILR
jgi:DNA polymerase-3 subunit alpha